MIIIIFTRFVQKKESVETKRKQRGKRLDLEEKKNPGGKIESIKRQACKRCK